MQGIFFQAGFVGLDGGGAEEAEVVLLLTRGPGGLAAARSRLPPGFIDILHAQGDHFDAVAMGVNRRDTERHSRNHACLIMI